MWLKDFIPKQWPAARIMSYGYNSNIFGKSRADIESTAEDLIRRIKGKRLSTPAVNVPILFIAHSLGGLLVKRVNSREIVIVNDAQLTFTQALALAHERSEGYGHIRDHTKFAMFFAVPHTGASLAKVATRIVQGVNTATMRFVVNPGFVESLVPGSAQQKAISTSFIELGGKLLLINTFYELQVMGNELVS
jgi:hypothetical protein